MPTKDETGGLIETNTIIVEPEVPESVEPVLGLSARGTNRCQIPRAVSINADHQGNSPYRHFETPLSVPSTI